MITIKLQAQRSDETQEVRVKGKSIFINREEFDFSPMVEGSTLPGGAVDCPWLLFDIKMVNGNITIPLIFPLPANNNPTQWVVPDIVNPIDGPISFLSPFSEFPNE